MGTLTDGQLLDRFVAQREGAVFEALVHRHGPMVWGVCRRVLRDHHDAEDAFQATFLVLAGKASTVRPREKLGNWLYGVAYQTAIRARATRARRRMREGQVTAMPEPEAVSQVQRDDLIEWLDLEISRLPETYRIPIVLCELEGKTHREAAEQLGWQIGTVSGRLSRARSILAMRLTRRGASLSAGSLAVLLAQESATASVPINLIGSTAQAASLFAPGGAVTAGVVSAGVAALTREVMQSMLRYKMKVVTAMVLVIALAGGAIGGLGFRGVQATASQEPKPTDSAEKSGPAASPALKEDDLRGTLLSLEKAGWESLKGKERSVASAALADDFVAVTADNGRLDRESFLKLLSDLTLTDYSLSDVAVTRLTQDAAVLTYRAKMSYTYKGEAAKEVWWISSAWAKRDGKWVSLLYQETRVKK
jgi:RNA polymerase sigma factor (sigma-70 family)